MILASVNANKDMAARKINTSILQLVIVNAHGWRNAILHSFSTQKLVVVNALLTFIVPNIKNWIIRIVNVSAEKISSVLTITSSTGIPVNAHVG